MARVSPVIAAVLLAALAPGAGAQLPAGKRVPTPVLIQTDGDTGIIHRLRDRRRLRRRAKNEFSCHHCSNHTR